MRSRSFRGAVSLALTIAASGPALGASEIVAGSRCARADGFCLVFGPAFEAPDVIRSINFDAPSRGTAAVSINGTLQCVNGASGVSNDLGVIDLTAQIVTGQATPVPDGPSGQRIAMRLFAVGAGGGATVESSNAINLAATRVVAVNKGPNAFRYKIAINRMDFGTYCYVFNPGLTVIFAP